MGNKIRTRVLLGRGKVTYPRSCTYIGETFSLPLFSELEVACAQLSYAYTSFGALERQCACILFQEPKLNSGYLIPLWHWISSMSRNLGTKSSPGNWFHKFEWIHRRMDINYQEQLKAAMVCLSNSCHWIWGLQLLLSITPSKQTWSQRKGLWLFNDMTH